MADRAKKVSELNAHSNAPANNLLVIVHQPGLANAETLKIPLSNLFANVSCNVVFTGNTIVIPSTAAPSTASSTGVKGELRFSNTHFYVCIANNTWVRAALSSW
jgi:hypothetical protein